VCRLFPLNVICAWCCRPGSRKPATGTLRHISHEIVSAVLAVAGSQAVLQRQAACDSSCGCSLRRPQAQECPLVRRCRLRNDSRPFNCSTHTPEPMMSRDCCVTHTRLCDSSGREPQKVKSNAAAQPLTGARRRASCPPHACGDAGSIFIMATGGQDMLEHSSATT